MTFICHAKVCNALPAYLPVNEGANIWARKDLGQAVHKTKQGNKGQ